MKNVWRTSWWKMVLTLTCTTIQFTWSHANNPLILPHIAYLFLPPQNNVKVIARPPVITRMVWPALHAAHPLLSVFYVPPPVTPPSLNGIALIWSCCYLQANRVVGGSVFDCQSCGKDVRADPVGEDRLPGIGGHQQINQVGINWWKLRGTGRKRWITCLSPYQGSISGNRPIFH